MSADIQSAWQEKYGQYAGDYEELLSFDPFEDWEKNTSPEVTAEDELRCGLETWFGGNHAQGTLFFERAFRLADRALTEKNLSTGLCKSGFPRNRGELLRIKSYSVGILKGSLDRQALIDASHDIAAMVQKYPEWDAQTEAYCLGAARAALIANDTAHARSLLEKAPEFSWHLDEARILLKLSSVDIKDQTESVSALEVFFDQVRDPSFSPDFFFELTIARLELAALCERAYAKNALPDMTAALARVVA